MRKFLITTLLFLGFFFPNTAYPSIKAIVFDFGGVIAQPDREIMIHFLSEALGLSRVDTVNVLHDYKHAIAKNVSEKQFWEDYAKATNAVLPADWITPWQTALVRSFKPIPGILAIINSLQSQGFRTGLLSNVTEQHAEIFQHLGYYKLFSPLLLSYEINAAKPDPRAYQILLIALNLSPEECIFIDDRKINIDGAKALGIEGIVFSSSEQLLRELAQKGIFINNSPQP